MGKTEVPTINFSGLELASEAWVATRAKMMEALDTVGFFTAEFDEVSDELFSVIDELFLHPLELKKELVTKKPYQGYIPSAPGAEFESHNIKDPLCPENVRALTDHLWPQGNPTVCDALTTYCKQIFKMELIIKRMILEGLGIGEHFNSFQESNVNLFGINKYSPPSGNSNEVAITDHVDPNFMTIIHQKEHEGLEILAKSGEWLYPTPKTINIMPGESLEVYSNGRIKACLHHVRLNQESKESRFSFGFVSQFRDGLKVEIPKELVNDEHPKLYKPFDYMDYMFFRFSGEGTKAKNPLNAYCGVNGDAIEV